MIRAILTSGSMRSLRHKPDRSCATKPGHTACHRHVPGTDLTVFSAVDYAGRSGQATAADSACNARQGRADQDWRDFERQTTPSRCPDRRPSIGRAAARQVETGASRERALVRGEPGDEGGDLLGPAGTPEWDFSDD